MSPPLRTVAARGGLITALTSWGRFALQFATVIVLARLLGPGSYGFAAVALVFTTLAEVIRASGLANVIIQRSEFDRAIASSFHYAAIALGVLGAGAALGVLWLLTGSIRISTVILATTPVFAGLATVPGAVLGREHAYRRLAIADGSASVVGCCAALAAAAAGAGSDALIVQAVLTAAVLAGLLLVFDRWRPGRPARLSAVRSELAFAGHSGVTQFSRYVAQNADRVAVSAAAGSAAAGLYAQANQLVALPVGQIAAPLHRVALPVLSRLKDEPERYARFLRTISSLVGLTVLPFLAGLAAVADDLILTLFGSAWSDSAALFRILMLAGCANVIVSLASWVLVSGGFVRLQARVTLATSALTVALIAVGALAGTVGIAIAAVVSAASTATATALACRRGGFVRLNDILRPLLPGAFIALLAGIVGYLTAALLPGSGVISLLAAGAAWGVAYASAVAALRPARHAFTDCLTALRAR